MKKMGVRQVEIYSSRKKYKDTEINIFADSINDFMVDSKG